MQTNNSKEKVRQLQNKLYLTAKKCDSRRFHALYDKVYRDDVLFEAWKRVKANKGSSGVDGCLLYTSVFMCGLTALEFLALRMEWNLPVLAYVTGDSDIYIFEEYRRDVYKRQTIHRSIQ